MINQLAISQINALVSDNITGTLVCFDKADKRKFHIPYVCEGDYLYSYSEVSEKIEIMRNDPTVLLKVYQKNNETDWSNAKILGIYEELKGIEAEIARCIIKDKMAAISESKYQPSEKPRESSTLESKLESSEVIYRIRMVKKSGKTQNLLQ